MQSVGTKLQEARLTMGWALEDVSSKTRISLKNLAAIEQNELSKLSSPFIYRSFVKQFAEAVNLDYELLAADVLDACSSMPAPLIPGESNAPIVRPAPIRVRVRPDYNWLYAAVPLVAIFVIASGYTYWSNANATLAKASSSAAALLYRERKLIKKVSADRPATVQRNQEIQASGKEPLADPDRPAASPAEDPAVKPGAETVSPGSPDLTKPAVSQPDASPPDTSSPHVEAPTPAQNDPESSLTAPSESDAAIHLELSASEPTWLSVTADGKQGYRGILEAAETKVLEGHVKALIRTGNAGGVSIVFNGKLLGTLGRRGQPLTFVFTKAGYEILEPSARLELIRYKVTGE